VLRIREEGLVELFVLNVVGIVNLQENQGVIRRKMEQKESLNPNILDNLRF
jgi:hypothetical protein